MNMLDCNFEHITLTSRSLKTFRGMYGDFITAKSIFVLVSLNKQSNILNDGEFNSHIARTDRNFVEHRGPNSSFWITFGLEMFLVLKTRHTVVRLLEAPPAAENNIHSFCICFFV